MRLQHAFLKKNTRRKKNNTKQNIDFGKVNTDLEETEGTFTGGITRLSDKMEPMMANVRPTSNRAGLDVYSSQGDASFIVKTIHLSCSSDAYRGIGHKYGGIIIYGHDGESEWCTANGTHCKSGYLVIQDTDDNCNPPQKQYPNEPGIVQYVAPGPDSPWTGRFLFITPFSS